jgi:gluconolactonase
MTKTNILILFFTFLITLVSCNSSTQGKKEGKLTSTDSLYLKTGSVLRLDNRMDQIVPPDELPEILARGFEWTEGPLWLNDQNILLFSDIPSNSIYQWSEKEGVKLYLKPAGYTDTIKRGGETGSNGLLLDSRGRLVLCQHGDRRIARMDAPIDMPVPKFVSISDNWQGKRLNSPNDAVYNSKGDLYFTDPPYGLEQSFKDPYKELNFNGVFKLSSDGKLTLLSDKFSAPNGVALSPDESKLYIANSGETDPIWWEFGFMKDGKLDEGRLIYNASEEKKTDGGSPDGMKVRSDGIIFSAGPGGVWVFSPDGKHLGTIKTGSATSNCAFGNNGKYLYMTTDSCLMRIKLK